MHARSVRRREGATGGGGARPIPGTGTALWFEAYHFIPTNSPLRLNTDTKLVGVAFAPDSILGGIDTPNGRVEFLQMVGITQRELDWLHEDPTTGRVERLIGMMREDNPLLITDLKRQKEYV